MNGTCPQASSMGFLQVETHVSSNLPMCSKILKATCCDTKSMKAQKNFWKLNMKRMGNKYWSASRLPLLGVMLLSSLNAKAKGCGVVAKTGTAKTRVRVRVNANKRYNTSTKNS